MWLRLASIALVVSWLAISSVQRTKARPSRTLILLMVALLLLDQFALQAELVTHPFSSFPNSVLMIIPTVFGLMTVAAVTCCLLLMFSVLQSQRPLPGGWLAIGGGLVVLGLTAGVALTAQGG